MRTWAAVVFPFGSRLPRLVLGLWLAAFALASYTAGAAGDKNSKDNDEAEFKEPKSIGDVAAVAGLQSYPVRGVGLVLHWTRPVVTQCRGRIVSRCCRKCRNAT